MLEQLFGSRTRVKLLRLFLGSPKEKFFVREITRVVEEQINSVRRELTNLEKMGLVISTIEDKKKYYTVNQEFSLLHELQALVLKTRLVSEKEFIELIRGLGPMDYFGLFGELVGDDDAPTDMLIVGTVSKTRLGKVLEQFSAVFGKQLRYTLFSSEEYQYRKDVADTFLYDLMNRKSLVIVNKLDNENQVATIDQSNPFFSSVHSPSKTRWTKDDIVGMENEDEEDEE